MIFFENLKTQVIFFTMDVVRLYPNISDEKGLRKKILDKR